MAHDFCTNVSRTVSELNQITCRANCVSLSISIVNLGWATAMACATGKLRDDANDTQRGYWEGVFDHYDHNRDGHIDILELIEFRRVTPDAILALFRRADTDGNAALDRAEFAQIMRDPATASFFQRHFVAYVSTICPPDAGREARRAWYAHLSTLTGVRLTCMTLLISLCLVVPFACDAALAGTTRADGPIAQALLYDPRRRSQAWRFLTYMLVHSGWTHLGLNLLIQLCLGLPLMAVNDWWRVPLVYASGVLAGSLGASVFAARHPLVGASAGVYALLTARAAYILLNCRETKRAALRVALVGSLMVAGALLSGDDVSWVAHCCGAVAGLLVGFVALRNRRESARERRAQIAFALVYVALALAAVGVNIFSAQLYK